MLLAVAMVAAGVAPVSRASAQEAGLVRGVVQTSGGRRVPDASVSVKTFARGKMDSVAMRTDANGGFALRVPGEMDAVVEIGGPGMSWAYQRMVTVSRDTVRLRVTLGRTSGTSSVVLADSASQAAQLIAAYQLLGSVTSLSEGRGRIPDEAATREAMRRVTPRLIAYWSRLQAPFLRVKLSHEIVLRGADVVDSALASRFAAEFDARDPVWDDLQYPYMLFVVTARTHFPRATFNVGRDSAFRRLYQHAMDSVLAINGVAASVREQVLRARTESAVQFDHDTAYARTLLAILERDFPGSDGLARARGSLEDRRKVRVGQPIPPFTVLAMGDTVRRTLDLAKARSHYTLVDFWATWCTPCVADIPGIGRALERWRGAGLAVVSVSFDGTADKVKRFRRARHPMPWEHWMAIGIDTGVTARELEIRGFPRTVLIDSLGRVVAEDGDVRGEQLAVTLTRLLGPGTVRK